MHYGKCRTVFLVVLMQTITNQKFQLAEARDVFYFVYNKLFKECFKTMKIFLSWVFKYLQCILVCFITSSLLFGTRDPSDTR